MAPHPRTDNSNKRLRFLSVISCCPCVMKMMDREEAYGPRNDPLSSLARKAPDGRRPSTSDNSKKPLGKSAWRKIVDVCVHPDARKRPLSLRVD
jgi:hypothetical protein